jgi:hypothetical protein
VLKEVLSFDPAANHWQTLATLPQARWNVSAVIHEGKLFVIGGITGTGDQRRVSGRVDVLNLSTGAWDVGPDLPVPLQAAGVVSWQSWILLFGGRDGAIESGAATDGIWMLSPASGEWSLAGKLTQARTGATATLHESTVVIAGGAEAEAPSTVVEYFDPASRGITRGAPLHEARTAHCAVLHGGEVLVMGGAVRADPPTATASVEAIPPLSSGAAVSMTAVPLIAIPTPAPVTVRSTSGPLSPAPPDPRDKPGTSRPTAPPGVITGRLVSAGTRRPLAGEMSLMLAEDASQDAVTGAITIDGAAFVNGRVDHPVNHDGRGSLFLTGMPNGRFVLILSVGRSDGPNRPRSHLIHAGNEKLVVTFGTTQGVDLGEVLVPVEGGAVARTTAPPRPAPTSAPTATPQPVLQPRTPQANPPPGAILGRILDAATGMPITANLSLALGKEANDILVGDRALTSPSEIGGKRYHAVEIRPDGSFELHGMPSGEWIVVAVFPSDQSSMSKPTREIQLYDATDSRLKVTLQPDRGVDVGDVRLRLQ